MTHLIRRFIFTAGLSLAVMTTGPVDAQDSSIIWRSPERAVTVIGDVAQGVSAKALTPVSPAALYQAAADALVEQAPVQERAALRAKPVSDLSGVATLFQEVKELGQGRISNDDLADAAIKGIVLKAEARNDYLPSQVYERMRRATASIALAPGEADVGLSLKERSGETAAISVADPLMPGWRAGVRPKDLLLRINGASTANETEAALAAALKGRDGSQVTLLLERAGVPFEVVLTRKIDCRCGAKLHMAGQVAVITIGGFNSTTSATTGEAVATARSVAASYILDLRGSPGGLLEQVVSLADLFMDGGEVMAQTGSRPGDIERYNARPGDLSQGKPLVIIVGPNTSSGAEILAGALRDQGRAVLVGMRTEGTGVIHTVIPILGGRGGALKIVTGRVSTPSGRLLDGIGIEPDIRVTMTGVVTPGDPALGARPVRDNFSRNASREAAGAKGIADQLAALEVSADDAQMVFALDLARRLAK